MNGKDQAQERWEQTAAQITQIHKMLKGMDLTQFIQYSELHISTIENQKDVDIKQIFAQKAAVEAFRDKGQALRIALNNMEVAANKFKKKYGKDKDKEQESKLQIVE